MLTLKKSKQADTLFFGALLFVTLTPLIVVPIFTITQVPIPGLYQLIAITGVGHVAFTALLFPERRLARVTIQNYQSLFLLPLGLIALFAYLQYQSGLAWDVAIVGYLCWQLHHYQRQNYGLIAFAAARTTLSLPRGINRALQLSTLTGVLGWLGNYPVLQSVRFYTWWLGLGALLAALVVLVVTCQRHRLFRRSYLVTFFSILSVLFFLPALISTDILVAFWSYAIAHGAQYIIFSMIVSETGETWRRALNLAIICVAFPALVILGNHEGMAGLYMGVVCAHFLIDAKLWRMREPVQREVIRERFAFAFRRAPGLVP